MNQLHKPSQSMIFLGVFILSVASVFINLEIPCGAVLFLVVVFCGLKNILSRKFAIILLILYLSGIVYTNYKIPQPDILSGFALQKAQIQGVVTSIPIEQNNKTKFELKVNKLVLQDQTLSGILGTTLVYLKNTNPNINIGDEITSFGDLAKPFEVENQYQFDYARYLQKRGIFSVFYAKNATFLTKKPTFKISIKKYFHNLSIKIQSKHLSNMDNKNANLLGGIVFGNRSIKVDEETAENFRDSGIYHVLSASGLHVGVVLLFWTYFMKLLRAPFAWVFGSASLVLLIFGGFTGFPPAVCRAILMAQFIILGKLIDRKANSLILLMLVAVLMLLYNPSYIADISFQLSFITTFGILFCLPFIQEKLPLRPDFVFGPIFLTLVAQIFSAPLLIYYFNTLPLYAVFANFFIVPLISVITFVGFLANIIAIFPKTGVIITTFDWFLSPLLNLSSYGAGFFAKAPHSTILIQQISILSVILMYIFIIFAAFCIKNAFKNKIYNIICSVSLVVVLLLNIPTSSKSLDITVFSLGNSDAILIEFPNHKRVLIDTGKSISKHTSSGKTILNNYFKARAINKLDLIILTHPDSDHIGGCSDIIDKFNVRAIYQPQIQSSSEIYKELQAKLKVKHIKTHTLPPLSKTIVDMDGNYLEILAPVGKSTNANSLITHLKTPDFSALFMGDAEKEAFPLIKKHNIKNIRLLKVGHHGSKGALDDMMIGQLRPEFAVICAKKNNKNHPHISTMKLLKKYDIKVYTTGNDNMLRFSYTLRGIEIKRFDSKSKKMVEG